MQHQFDVAHATSDLKLDHPQWFDLTVVGNMESTLPQILIFHTCSMTVHEVPLTMAWTIEFKSR